MVIRVIMRYVALSLMAGTAMSQPMAAPKTSETASENSKRHYLRRLLEVNPAVLLGDFQACDSFDMMQRLGQVRVPTLAICGTEDRLTPPKYSEFLQQHVPEAQLLLLEEAGHMVMLEKPAAISAAIGDFVRQVGADDQISAVDDQ